MQFRQLTVYTYRYIYIYVCGSSCVDLAKSLEARVALGKWVYREMMNCIKKRKKNRTKKKRTHTKTYSRLTLDIEIYCTPLCIV